MKKQRGYATIVGLVIIAIWVAAICGWIANIAKIVSTMSDPITGVFIARIVGVFAAPLGAVLGYF